MKMVQMWMRCGVVALALGLVMAAPATAQQYGFHPSGVDGGDQSKWVSGYKFPQTIKRSVAVADLALSMVNYITNLPSADTNKFSFVFEDAANRLIFGSQINVEFSGDTVKIPLVAFLDQPFFQLYDPSTAPFTVVFSPNERGFFEDTLTFIVTYPTIDTLKFPIDGEGIGFLKLLNTSAQRVDSAFFGLNDTRVGDSLPGDGRSISVINTSTNQLGKIEDVVMSDVGEFHIVNPQLEIQPGATAILSVQFTAQDLGTSAGWGKIVSDDFAIDTAYIGLTGTGVLGLDYFTNDDTTDINGETIHTIVDDFTFRNKVVGDTLTRDTLIWIQNRLNQNVEVELVMGCGQNGIKLLSQFGAILNESDTLFAVNNMVTFRDSTYLVGDTIRIGCDVIEVTAQTVVPTVLSRTLPLNDSLRVWLRLDPATRGTFFDSIETTYKPFINSQATVSGLFPVEGTSRGPGFGYDRDSIDFGPLTPGLTLRDSIALFNDTVLPGELPVAVSIDTSGLDPVYTLLTEASFVYTSSDTFYVVFEYAAADSLFHLDTVPITSSDPNNPVLSLILTGGTQAPVVLSDLSTLNYGDVVVSDSLSLDIQVLNIGLTTLNVSNITVNQGAIFTPTPTAFAVAPGAGQTVSVKFVPGAPIAYPDTLVIASDDPKTPVFRVPIVAGGSNPMISTPGSLTFGATTLNSGSLVDAVGVTNNGTRGNLICSVTVVNGTYFDLPVPGDSLIFVDSQTTRQVAVRFSQQDTAVVFDSLRIATNDPANPVVYVELSGGGFFRQLDWVSGPLKDTTLYDYGKVSTLVAETLTSVMTNLGNDTLGVTSITFFSGTQGFSRITPGVTRLLQSEQFDVSVSFTPAGSGLFEDTMLIITTDTTAGNDSIVVPLVANAYVPGLLSNVTFFAFDTTAIGSTNLDSIGFLNPGEVNVTVESAQMSIGSRFNVAAIPDSIAPDVTDFVKIIFSPSDTIVYFDTLTVITTQPDDTIVIPLEGTGAGGKYADNKDELLFTPTPVFGSSQQTFTVFNLGNKPLQIDSIFTQNPIGAFQRLSPAEIVLGAGQQATVTMGFFPLASAAYQDTLVLTTTDQSNARVKMPLFGETPDQDINFARDRLIRFPDPELDLGSIKVGNFGSKNLVVYNSGLDTLIIKTAKLLINPSSFGIVQGQWSDTLSARDSFFTDTAGNVVFVDSMFGNIRYTPSEKKAADTNYIRIISTDPDEDTVIVRLIAHAVAGQLAITSPDSSVDFGTIKVGTLDTSEVVSVKNTFGNNRVRLSMADFMNPPQPDYAIEAAIHRVGQPRFFSPFDPGNLPTLGKDSIISFRWIYAPADTGTDADMFRVIGTPDNAGDTIDIPISGRGAAPSISVRPGFLDYGTLSIAPGAVDSLWVGPDTVRELRVIIDNPGTDTLIIDTLLTANAGAANYNNAFVGIGFTPFPWMVPPGGSLNEGIRVKVTQRKIYYDTIQLVNNDPFNDPLTLYTRVVGTAPGDIGFIDTVRISDYEYIGSQVVVPVHLIFDEAIKRFSIPLRYTSQVYECVGLDFNGTLLEGADGLVPVIDTVNNTVSIKGNIIFGPYIRPDEFIGTVFANMLFEARGASSTDSSITFDTTFIPPDNGYGLQDSNLLVILPEFVPRRLDIITGVEEGVLPTDFVLDQNYPNPFNPRTTIAFTAPRAGHVTLTVYNLLGQRILTLVDEVVSPGTYEFEWNGADERGKPVSSGIYFYHLSAMDFSETKKMVLMK